MEPLIYCEKLSKTYQAGRADAFHALLNAEVRIPAGEVVTFKGPSGSGKTTLLALLGCMTRPTQGRVVVAGRDVSRLPERFLTEVRRKTFGFIFQQFHLLRHVSVLENVLLPLYPDKIGFRDMRKRGMKVLERLDIADKALVKVQKLSGGEQQRVAIARALINEPQIVIADEPTAHLDHALAEDFLGIMAELNRQNTTILMASHDPLVCEHSLVQRTISLRDGHIVTRDGA